MINFTGSAGLILPFLLIAIVTTDSAYGNIANLPFPPALIECFQNATNARDSRSIVGEMVTNICIREFLWATGDSRWNPSVDPRMETYIGGIFSKYMKKYGGQVPLRVRKEYRRLTDKERSDFHYAVNELKKDRSLKPNKYDAIADFHNAAMVTSAHGGPNFFGWHRVYLVLFEDALREISPNVTIPYWDCTLDAELYNPAKSIIFSSLFAGNGKGIVKNGPFKYWRHDSSGQLTRNVGVAPYSLINKEDVERILSREKNEDISLPLKNNFEYALEVLHGNVHQFINGQMGTLITSPHDPIFFMLHAFVDYIWFLFRSNQILHGIDPSKDYPWTPSGTLHSPNQQMQGFKNASFLNIDGYSNKWTNEVYTYELSPTCSASNTDCGSPYLYCNVYKQRCVSKPLNTRIRSRYRRRRRYKREDVEDIIEDEDVLELVDDNEENENEVSEEDQCEKMESTYQNTFMLDGVADSSKWVYLPIKVIYQRRVDEHFDSYAVHRGKVMDQFDIYNPVLEHKYTNYNKWWGNQKTIDGCYITKSGNTRVFVETNGINYLGSSLEFTSIDERTAFSSSYVYVPVKEPSSKGSEIFIVAYDSCGRLCKPKCKVSPDRYEACTGVVSLNQASPYYGKTYTDAVLKVWRTEKPFSMPQSSDDNVHMVFFCDLDETWPWQGKDSA